MRRPVSTVCAILLGILLGAATVSAPVRALVDSSSTPLVTVVGGIPQAPTTIPLRGIVTHTDSKARALVLRIQDPRANTVYRDFSIHIEPEVQIRKRIAVYQKDTLTHHDVSLISMSDITPGSVVDITLSRSEGPLRSYYVLVYEL